MTSPRSSVMLLGSARIFTAWFRSMKLRACSILATRRPFSVSEMQELVFSYWSEIESGFAITFEGDRLFSFATLR